MKKIYALLLFVLIGFLAGCTNQQLEEAIDACQGDPACYSIIDQTITEELAARGIETGEMTNLELIELNQIVESLSFSFFGVDLDTYTLEQRMAIGDSLGMLFSNTYLVDNDTVRHFLLSQKTLFDFNLKALVDNETQFILLENEKHLVFKESRDRFTYEIQRPTTVQEFTFDTTFNSITGLPGIVTETAFLNEISAIDGIALNEDNISYFFNSNPARIDLGYLSPNGYMMMTFYQNSLMVNYGDYNTSSDIGYELLYDTQSNQIMIYSSVVEDFVYVDYTTFVSQLFTDMNVDTNTEFYSYFNTVFTETVFNDFFNEIIE
jgi:hypothetical protein